MKSLSGKEFCQLLEERGWELLRIKGSHHIFGKKGCKIHLSIPVHGSRPLKIGLQKYFMKIADISEEDFY
ncbi:MAG: type II toxin-antitoxin system HicA family toxin [Candidatus Atribacteria bacterium]|nr:type II toxin-antitoxin system HicA family toxin [Candidatus Atribacteria bacterium]